MDVIQPSFMNCWSDYVVSSEEMELVIPSNVCNDEEVVELDLSGYSELRTIEIGSNSFASASSIVITGLAEVENITVGSGCGLRSSLELKSGVCCVS